MQWVEQDQAPEGEGYVGRNEESPAGADCDVCHSGTHGIDECPRFLDRSIPDRKLLLFSLNRCFNCLGAGHRGRHCTSNRCSLCGYSHHQLLCSRQQGGAAEPERDRLYVAMEPEIYHQEELIPADDELAETAEHPGDDFVGWALLEEGLEPGVQTLTVSNEPGKGGHISLRFVVVVVRNPRNGKWSKVAGLLDDGVERLTDVREA